MRSIPILQLVVSHCDVEDLSLISLWVQVRPSPSEEGAVWFLVCRSASSCGREEAMAHHVPVARAVGFPVGCSDYRGYVPALSLTVSVVGH